MEEHTLSELSPVLENGKLIDDFFAAATDYIYDKADLDSAASSFVEKARKEYF